MVNNYIYITEKFDDKIFKKNVRKEKVICVILTDIFTKLRSIITRIITRYRKKVHYYTVYEVEKVCIKKQPSVKKTLENTKTY